MLPQEIIGYTLIVLDGIEGAEGTNSLQFVFENLLQALSCIEMFEKYTNEDLTYTLFSV